MSTILRSKQVYFKIVLSLRLKRQTFFAYFHLQCRK
nr:MAG TPA: hypothetical protein [Caudoviricetes sp.]